MNVACARIGSWCIVRVTFSANLRKWCFRHDCYLVITGDKIPEVESKTKGSRPIPKPRTQKKSEAKGSLSEDRPSRGQGQECSRPRTKDTAASLLQKKGLQKSYLGDLRFIGVPKIFDWGRPKSQITGSDVIKIFPNRKFLWDKDIVGRKVWNRCL